MKLPLIAACALTLTTAAHAQNLAADSGFEFPKFGDAAVGEVNVGTKFRHWLATGPAGTSIQFLGTNYAEPPLRFNAHGGKQALDITGSFNQGAVGVQQTIATVPGTAYILTFWVGNIDGAYPLPSGVTLAVGGTDEGTFTNADITPNLVNWKQFSVEFTATKKHTIIAFGNAPNNDNYCGLDDISVTPKP